MHGRVIAYFPFSKWRPSAILNFIFPQFLCQNSNLRLYLRRRAKFGEDRTIRGRVIAYIRFSNGGCPPSWIWYDVIADHPRLVFDGPNILLKLHVYPLYILRDIAIFIYWPVWLEIAYSHPFWGVFGDMTGSPWNWVSARGVKNKKLS